MPLVLALLALMLFTGLGTVLVLGTMTETAITRTYREGMETFYAADAAVEFVIQDLAGAPDWDAVTSGDTTSAFVDGPPGGIRALGAATVDLSRATSDVNIIAATEADTASYRLYAYGRFADLLPASMSTALYVAVWVADLSGASEQESGSRLLGVVGQAFGPTGSRRSVAVSVARAVTSDEAAPAPLRVLSWAELR